MTNSEFWLLKLNALLHDPPNKPFDIQKHEGQSNNWAKILGITLTKRDFQQADWIASAADRLNFPKYRSIGGASFRNQPYLTHPLAGVRLNLSKGRFLPTQIDESQLQQAIRKSLESIKPEIKQDPQKLFLWLWRNWSDEIQRTEGSQLGALWDLLPADTRIPDHSIWSHQALTSAIAATNSDPAFLLFTIGPVQAFISAARRTQDLWTGSYLLSYLNWCAIQVIADAIGPDAVIFPNLVGQPLCDRWLHSKGILSESPRLEDLILPSLPNRFLAIVPTSQGEDLAKEAADRVRSQWQEISQAVRLDLETVLGQPPAWSKTWERQITNLFETYWQVYPWRPTGTEPIQADAFELLEKHRTYLGDRTDRTEKILSIYSKDTYQPNIGAIYSDLYFITEKALGSRKGLRNFLQVEETGDKSTLGGERAALYDGIDHQNSLEDNFDGAGRSRIRHFWINLAKKLESLEIQDTGQERLDAVEVSKRLAWRSYFKNQLISHQEQAQTSDDDIEEVTLEEFNQLKFPSTATVATADFKKKVLESFLVSDSQRLRQAMKQWLDAIRDSVMRKGNYIKKDVIPFLSAKLEQPSLNKQDKSLLLRFLKTDGRLLFEETYYERVRELAQRKEEILFALCKLKEFLKIVTSDQYKIPKPRKYFAVLMMDGDNMGEWIAGDKMPEYEKILHPQTRQALEQRQDWQEILKSPRLMSPAIHGFISKALGDFSLKLVRHIVENRYPGKLVYSGGDDVLALLPLDFVLEVARELRAAFSGEVKTNEAGEEFQVSFGDAKTGYIWLKLRDEDKPRLLATMGHKATASTGIVLAHYKQALDVTLTEVRKAEKAAKRQECRNALSLTFLKRSGEIMSAGAKWTYPEDSTKDLREKSIDTVDILLKFQGKFANDEISGKFPYVLREQAETLSRMVNASPPLNRDSLENLYTSSLKDVYIAEIKRLLNRQQGGKPISKHEQEELAENLSHLVMQADLEQSTTASQTGKLKTFADLLVFTRFLARVEAGEEE